MNDSSSEEHCQLEQHPEPGNHPPQSSQPSTSYKPRQSISENSEKEKQSETEQHIPRPSTSYASRQYDSESSEEEYHSETEKHISQPSTSYASRPSDSDEEVNKAYEASLKEDSILPILKKELRLKIQTRRLSEGQEELVTGHESPPVYILTEEEKAKYQRRLQQNRESLKRTRRRELQKEVDLKLMYDREMTRQRELNKKKEDLLKEKEMLLQSLRHAGLEYKEDSSTVTCTICNMDIHISEPS